jgi:hypothetical protein
MATKRLSGGGIESNKRREVPVRVGKPREGINVVAVSRLGAMQGNHVTERGKTLPNPPEPLVGKQRPISVTMGNAVAYGTKAGPGGSRTIYRAGVQHTTPAPNEMPKGRDTLFEFGPDFRGRGSRR